MNVAIIVAAGQGTRIGGARAKQFLDLAGTPIIIRTIEAFERCELVQEIVLVLPAQDASGFMTLAGQYAIQKVTRIVPGGRTRAESVWHGLQAIGSAATETVAVHDGVRPFVTGDEIARTFMAAQEHGAAILVAPVVDTIKEVDAGSILRGLPRSRLRRALTPQCFRYDLLRSAYEQVDLLDPDLTDDAVLFERLGLRVATVDGSSQNIKITQPEDLILAQAILDTAERTLTRAQ